MTMRNGSRLAWGLLRGGGAPRWKLALLGHAVPEKIYTVEHGERKTRFQQPRVVSLGHGRVFNPNRNPNLACNFKCS
jgi:hypothetical protein